MKTKLIMVEGIPGSGKSTMAQKVSNELSNLGIWHGLVTEGMVHPANLDAYAILTETQLEDYIHNFPDKEEIIRREAEIFTAQYLLKKQPSWDVDGLAAKYLNPYSIWDQGMDFERFTSLQFLRWQQFIYKCQIESKVYVFDCAFLQDHITEMMLFYDVEEKQLLQYFKKLDKIIRRVNPYLIYLQQADVETTLRRVAKERVDEQGNPVWMEGISGFISQSLYGKTYGLSGFDGLLQFYRRRKELDLFILKNLSVPYQCIDNNQYEWEAVEREVRETVDRLAGEN